MFVDEELQIIWDTKTDLTQGVTHIYQTLVRDVVSLDNFVASVKRADNIFRLFAKRNNLNQDWFKNQLKETILEDEAGDEMIKVLGW